MRLPQEARTITFAANRADAYNMSRLAETTLDARGSPFLDWPNAIRLALDLARRVVDAGEVERYRPQPAGLVVPSPDPEQAAEVSAFLARYPVATKRR